MIRCYWFAAHYHCFYHVEWKHEEDETTQFYAFDKPNNKDTDHMFFYLISSRDFLISENVGEMIFQDKEHDITIYRNFDWQVITKAFESCSNKEDFTKTYFDNK